MKTQQQEKSKPANRARRCKWQEMNRKQRREMMRKLQSESDVQESQWLMKLHTYGYEIRFGQCRRSARCGPIGGSATIWCEVQADIFNGIQRIQKALT